MIFHAAFKIVSLAADSSILSCPNPITHFKNLQKIDITLVRYFIRNYK